MNMQEKIIEKVAKEIFNLSFEEYAVEQGKHDVEWDKALIDETIRTLTNHERKDL